MDENTSITRPTVVWQPPSSEFARRAEALHTTVPEVYLHPGQSLVADYPATLKMILGSCAGVFLFDPALRIGGASHFMLPSRGEGPPSSRYGDVAIAELLERFRTLGSNPRNIQAKIFGGASMVQALENLSGSRFGQIGLRNIETTIKILGQESIAIVKKSVFGNQARKVSMDSSTGVITLEFVSSEDGNR
jgi:chemotaxis protein CheD